MTLLGPSPTSAGRSTWSPMASTSSPTRYVFLHFPRLQLLHYLINWSLVFSHCSWHGPGMAAVPLPKVPCLSNLNFINVWSEKNSWKPLPFQWQGLWRWGACVNLIGAGLKVPHYFSICPLIICVLLILHTFNRSLTATFSGKIEFSVVSTNGEKVFRKKKSIKVGKEGHVYMEAMPPRNISGVRHPDWETHVWSSSCQIHPTQVHTHDTWLQHLLIDCNTSDLKCSACFGWTSKTTRSHLMTRY